MAAFPKLYVEEYLTADGCPGPDMGFKGHAAPTPDSDLVFAMTSASGDPVTSWEPGTEYTLTISHATIAFHAYVYSSVGAPPAPHSGGDSTCPPPPRLCQAWPLVTVCRHVIDMRHLSSMALLPWGALSAETAMKHYSLFTALLAASVRCMATKASQCE